MSDGPPDDPFRAEDPRAAEREARRREREERRKARSSGARRSLGSSAPRTVPGDMAWSDVPPEDPFRAEDPRAAEARGAPA